LQTFKIPVSDIPIADTILSLEGILSSNVNASFTLQPTSNNLS
jgi:hypothetical protein